MAEFKTPDISDKVVDLKGDKTNDQTIFVLPVGKLWLDAKMPSEIIFVQDVRKAAAVLQENNNGKDVTSQAEIIARAVNDHGYQLHRESFSSN